MRQVELRCRERANGVVGAVAQANTTLVGIDHSVPALRSAVGVQVGQRLILHAGVVECGKVGLGHLFGHLKSMLVHHQRVARHITLGCSVSPAGLERVIGHLVGLGHEQCALAQTSRGGDVDLGAPGIGAAQGDGCVVGAMSLGSEGQSHLNALLGVAQCHARIADAEHLVLVGQLKHHIVSEVAALDSECGSGCLVIIAGEVDAAGRRLDKRTDIARLDADDHLLILVEGCRTVAEGVERKVAVAVTAPAIVDVIQVAGGVIAVDVERVAALTRNGAVDNGALLDQLGLDHLGPLGVAVDRLSTII